MLTGSLFCFRYADNKAPKQPLCGHSGKGYDCRSLKLNQITDFHRKFYCNKTKVLQDAFILKNIQVQAVKRRRRKPDEVGNQPGRAPKTTSCQFSIPVGDHDSLRVCQKTFIDILRITRGRVRTIIANFKEDGNTPREKRGGDRKKIKYARRIESIVEFIKKLKCIESHYCRGKSERKYLSSDLNIVKLYKMYCSGASALPVKKGFFRQIFNTKFNLGFKGPRTDVCSTCLSLEERIKAADDSTKANLICEKRVHKLRAKAFYNLLKEDKPLTFSFDLQKNLPMPKVPDQQAYYSRQLYLHNLTVVQGHSKAALGPHNSFSYCWTEDKFGKSSNEVASAIYHRLQNTDMSNIKTVRLFCDGCAGQNKNRIVLTMVMKWFSQHAPGNVKEVQLVFPTRGHSFLPPDRVFGMIEKKIRKVEVIANPEEYKNLMVEYSTVLNAQTDFNFFDWKSVADEYVKLPASWHFKITQSKRLFIKRSAKNAGAVLVLADANYNTSTGTFQQIVKGKKKLSNAEPAVLSAVNINNVSRAKLTDVHNLLTTHFGADWRENSRLDYFLGPLKHINSATVPEPEELLCDPNDCQEELPLFSV